MAEISQNFFKGKMNKDLDERFLEDGEYFHAENIRVASPSEGNVGVVKNIPSSIARIVYNSFPNIKALSFAKDEINNKIYLFLKADNVKDFIVEYDTVTKTSVSIVETYYPNSILNFADDVFTEAKILDGYLIWTDNINPPRKINIATMRLKAFNSIKEDDLSLIKKPPLKEPTLILIYDSSKVQNNFEKSMVKIAYRYIYEDNSKSSTSFWSETAYLPDVTNILPINKVTRADAIIDTGDDSVTDIEILVKDVNSNNIYINQVINKSKLNIASLSKYTVSIEDVKKGAVMPEQESLKLFDNVPLTAKEISVVDSRLFFGDYIDGYSFTGNTDIKINPSETEITLTLFNSKSIETGLNTKMTFNFTGFTVEKKSIINFTASFKQKVITDARRNTIAYKTFAKISTTHISTAFYSNFTTFFTTETSFIQKIQEALISQGITATVVPTANQLVITVTNTSVGMTDLTMSGYFFEQRQYLSYRHEVPYSFGLVYYDKYNRSTTVIPFKNNVLQFDYRLPINNNWTTLNANIEIKHIAPSFAKKFKIVRTAHEHTHELLRPIKIRPVMGGVEVDLYDFVDVSGKPTSDRTIEELNKVKVGAFIDVFQQQSPSIKKIAQRATLEIESIKTEAVTILSITRDVIRLICKWKVGNEASLTSSNFTTTTDSDGRNIASYNNILAEVSNIATTKPNFYETSQTFEINENGYHIGGDVDQTITTPFSITLSDGDTFIDTYGRFHYKLKNITTGIEFDSVNYLRANNITSTGGQQHRYASITYSGKYVKENSLNELNSFNLASGNFEDFNKINGDIMKMHPREGDLLVFQENGINKILLGKSVLYGGDGTVNVSAIENVLGQKIEFPYRNGISKNPESFDYDGNVVFFSDANRGVICALDNDGLIEISDTGMSGFFKQLLKDNSSVKIKGAYDKINEEYVINIVTSNDNKTLSFNKNAKGWITFYDYKPELIIPINNKLFTIGSESNTLTLYEHGYDYNFRGNLHGKQVKSKITTFLNKEYETAKIANYISLDSTHPCETKLSTDDKHTTIYENEFVEKEDSFVAYVRRNENTTDKSGKHLKGLSNFVSLNNKTITVTLQLDSSLIRIGDTLCKYNSTDGVVNIGVIESYIGNTITVNAVNTTLSNGDFILSKRSLREEGSAIRGDVFKAEVTMPTTNSTVELSSITLGVSKSFV